MEVQFNPAIALGLLPSLDHPIRSRQLVGQTKIASLLKRHSTRSVYAVHSHVGDESLQFSADRSRTGRRSRLDRHLSDL
jgi:hypothetical protein